MGKIIILRIFRMFLFLLVPFIHILQPLLLFILDFTRQKGTTEELIKEIDQKLKTISQQEHFVEWARLTRKRQGLEKMLEKESKDFKNSSVKNVSLITKCLSFVVFLFYRSAAVISIDELLFPTWFVKLASFYGLGFIRYGDVSCFIWYFCSKSVINMLLSSFESTKKLSNQSEMPDLLANLVQPKLD